MAKRSYATVGFVALIVGLSMWAAGCADRLEPSHPKTYLEIDQVKEWSESHASPYSIPERSMRAYAYAASKMSQEGCTLGWPTLAALGSVFSNHGFTHGSEIGENGVSTVPLRDLDLVKLNPVADTDQGRIDGNPEHDIPVGPFQIMPSRWEQFEKAVEPGTTANPDSIDDSALTVAHQLCIGGDLNSSEGWDTAIKNIDADPEFVKNVHAKAKEYSR